MSAALLGLLWQHRTGFSDFKHRVWWMAVPLLLAAIMFGMASTRVARRFVTHLEIWPQSSLAVIKTAGILRERVSMVGWNEFATGQVRRIHISSEHESPLRVRLRSRRVLMFDFADSETPRGVSAVHRFVSKGSVPDHPLTEVLPPGVNDARLIPAHGKAGA